MPRNEDNKSGGRPGFAKRSLGQNFLIDTGCVERIVASLSLTPSDTVIEIGPGRGALTGNLIDSGANVIAVEIDRDLAPALRARFLDRTNFRIIEADFLKISFGELFAGTEAPEGLKLAANLPYNISTLILRRLFAFRQRFSVMALMLQKEVAERVVAEPGEPARGFLTVLMERGFKSEILFDVPPGSFRPVPKVTSSVVRMKPRPGTEAGTAADERFESLASASFMQKRKTLKNNLQAAPAGLRQFVEEAGGAVKALEAAGIEAAARAEALTAEEWERLASVLFEPLDQ